MKTASIHSKPYPWSTEEVGRFHKEALACYKEFESYWIKPRVIESSVGNINIKILDDTVQEIGAFKIRGATSALAKASRLNVNNIFCASSGSFGMAISSAAKKFNLQANIYMPGSTPEVKQKKIKSLGGNVVAKFESYEEAKSLARKMNLEPNSVFVDGVSWEVYLGNASLGFESFLKSNSNLKKKIAVIVPLGIGSLAVPLSLLSKYAGLNLDLFTSEPENYAKFVALHEKQFKPSNLSTVADGAAVYEVPEISLKILNASVPKAYAFSENEIRRCIQFAHEKFNYVYEGAGVLSLCPILYDPGNFLRYDEIWCYLTGSNISEETLSNILTNDNR